MIDRAPAWPPFAVRSRTPLNWAWIRERLTSGQTTDLQAIKVHLVLARPLDAPWNELFEQLLPFAPTPAPTVEAQPETPAPPRAQTAQPLPAAPPPAERDAKSARPATFGDIKTQITRLATAQGHTLSDWVVKKGKQTSGVASCLTCKIAIMATVGQALPEISECTEKAQLDLFE